jgi:hypothetical protein
VRMLKQVGRCFVLKLIHKQQFINAITMQTTFSL